MTPAASVSRSPGLRANGYDSPDRNQPATVPPQRARRRNRPTRVVVADTQRLFVEALTEALDDYADLAVCRSNPVTGSDAVKQVTRCKADVLLIDYWVTGLGGVATTRAILKLVPTVKVLFLSW